MAISDADAKARLSALLPAAVFAWFGVFIAGAVVDGWLEQALCPPEDWASNMCFNQHVDDIRDAMVNVYAGISALVVGLTCVCIAPSDRSEVAWVTLLIGSGLAICYGIAGGEADRVASAVGTGFVGTLAIEAWLRKKDRTPSPPVA